MIVGFDATTLHGRISGVGYYTARLMESLANGAGDGVVERLVVLAHREVPVPAGGRLEVYEHHRLGVRFVWMQAVLPWILRRLRPDLVHFTNYLAPLAAGVPYVLSIHDMTLALFPEYHPLRRRLLTSCGSSASIPGGSASSRTPRPPTSVPSPRGPIVSPPPTE